MVKLYPPRDKPYEKMCECTHLKGDHWITSMTMEETIIPCEICMCPDFNEEIIITSAEIVSATENALPSATVITQNKKVELKQ